MFVFGPMWERSGRWRTLATTLALISVLILTMAGKAAHAQTFSNEQAWDDGTNFYYQASYTGSYAHFNVFLDTDSNASTGYAFNGVGADYLIEDTGFYRYSGSGGGWGWTSVTATVTQTYPTSGTVKFSVPLSAFGSPTTARVAFQALDVNWNGTADPHIITFTKKPATPGGLTASPGNSQITLNWNASSGATSYNVYRGTTSSGEDSTPLVTGITGTSYTNTGLSNGTTYYFKVSAVNAGGTSGMSNEASAVPTSSVSYYVSPTGSDSNAGTISAPWRTSQKAGNSATPGSTVYFRSGTYGHFDVNVSGSASAGYITFTHYPGETTVIDGTGWTGSYDHGVIHILDQSYIKINGFEIRNGSSTVNTFGPCGVFVQGYTSPGSNVQVLNNYIHNITNTAGSNGNAHGILVRGENSSTPLTSITVSGNTVSACQTGWSESLTVAANVDGFTVSNNSVHDNNNIGIDATGGYNGEGNGAQARNGTVSGNVVYNCSTLNNPYYSTYSCAGLYVDGGTNIVMERNVVHHCDYGIELSAENPGVNTSYVTARNNLIYANAGFGCGIGGYNAGSTGGTNNCTIANNTFYNNDTNNWWTGEWHCGWRATNNVFVNNIVYAGQSNDFFFRDDGTDGANVGTFDYNIYYSLNGNANAKWQWINQTSYVTTFASWKAVSGQDAHSSFSDPRFVSTTTPDFDLLAGSPALNSGNYSLGASVYGTLDFAGNARTRNGTIDIGAYEN